MPDQVCDGTGFNPGSDDWFETCGMDINDGNLVEGLFADLAMYTDPWHWLPMTRWTHFNDLFQTSEGGAGGAITKALFASYAVVVSWAFTLASLLWSITIWLVRLMVGAPTLAGAFLEIMRETYDKYTEAILTSGIATAVLVAAMLVAVWHVYRSSSIANGFRTLMASVLPLALMVSLYEIRITAEYEQDIGASTPAIRHDEISGSEWLFVSALNLSSEASSLVMGLTDDLVRQEGNAPDQLVTCDSYIAVLEGNFMRAWHSGGAHYEHNPNSTDAPGNSLSRWSQNSNQMRMRLALLVSRIWERSYATGIGQAQFGDAIAAERAFCLLADWRNRDVTPLEQLAIWRATCNLPAYESLGLGDYMPLAGCSMMPPLLTLRSPAQQSTATKPGGQLVEPDPDSTAGTGRPAKPGGQFVEPDPDSTAGTGRPAKPGGQFVEPDPDDPILSAIDADAYAAAIFSPSTRTRGGGDVFQHRTFMGAWSMCDYTSWYPTGADPLDLREFTAGPPPLYAGNGITVADSGNEFALASYVVLPGSAGIAKIDRRFLGLGGSVSGAKPQERASADACAAFLFGDHGIQSETDENVLQGTSAWAHLYLRSNSGTECGDIGDRRALGSDLPNESVNVRGKQLSVGNCGGYWSSGNDGNYPSAAGYLGDNEHYPGAGNDYVLHRLGRTPEQYRASASYVSFEASSDGTGGVHEFVPTDATAQQGADIVEAIHGRSRGQLGILALLSVVVAFVYLMSLSGLALGAALSVVLLALVIATLPLSLLASAMPIQAVRSLPKKLFKLGVGAALSYTMFTLVLTMILVVIDLLMDGMKVASINSSEILYGLLLGLAPYLSIKVVSSISKQFGVDISKAKGAFQLTSGLAMANMSTPNANAQRYMRRGMSALTPAAAYGGAVVGNSMRTNPRGVTSRQNSLRRGGGGLSAATVAATGISNGPPSDSGGAAGAGAPRADGPRDGPAGGTTSAAGGQSRRGPSSGAAGAGAPRADGPRDGPAGGTTSAAGGQSRRGPSSGAAGAGAPRADGPRDGPAGGTTSAAGGQSRRGPSSGAAGRAAVSGEDGAQVEDDMVRVEAHYRKKPSQSRTTSGVAGSVGDDPFGQNDSIDGASASESAQTGEGDGSGNDALKSTPRRREASVADDGRVRRTLRFMRAHPAMAVAGVAAITAGFGPAVATYGAMKFGNAIGVHRTVGRAMGIRLPQRPRGRRQRWGDLQLAAGGARRVRGQIAKRIDASRAVAGRAAQPGASGASQPIGGTGEAQIPDDSSGSGLGDASSQDGAAPPEPAGMVDPSDPFYSLPSSPPTAVQPSANAPDYEVRRRLARVDDAIRDMSGTLEETNRELRASGDQSSDAQQQSRPGPPRNPLINLDQSI